MNIQEIEKTFKEYIIRVLVEVNHYITDENGVMLLTHTDTIETDSNTLSKAKPFSIKDRSVTITAKEIRLYGNTNSPIHLKHTIILD